MQKVIEFGIFDDKPLEWIVLYEWTRSRKALVISRYGMFQGPFDKNKMTSWEDSRIRDHLNDDFIIETFSVDERSKILPVKLPREKANMQNSDVYDTYDHVFLLSENEANRFLPDERAKVCYTNDTEDEKCAWWLRSRIPEADCVSYVDRFGIIDKKGHWPTMDSLYIRPALYLDMLE